ncbi:hypothetical protein C8R44DRAFT_772921 [Mycena epipterygia]|nr:hypothetical protein C8R44DRAFT_772921 [Mycena epipterygia]
MPFGPLRMGWSCSLYLLRLLAIDERHAIRQKSIQAVEAAELPFIQKLTEWERTLTTEEHDILVAPLLPSPQNARKWDAHVEELLSRHDNRHHD